VLQSTGVGTRYFTIPISEGSLPRKEFQELDLAPCFGDVYDVTSLFAGIDDSFLLPDALPCSYIYSRARSLRSTLTREIHTAQKAAQVSRQRNETDCQKFNRQTVAWQIYSPLSGADMYPPHQPYHHARDAREYQVQQKNSLQLLSLELELPRE